MFCLQMLTQPGYSVIIINVTFSLALAHSNQHLNSPVFAMCKAYNNIPNQIDIFASDIQEFKTVLSGKLRNRMLRIEEQS